MEFLSTNIINTTTQISVSNNTGTSQNLFNRDPAYQYYTDGLGDDSLTCSIVITFDETTAVSRIALSDINFKEFNMYYNGITANSFSLVNADTTASQYTGNSDQYKFFRFNTLMVSSITIDAKKTITVNQEKVFGHLYIGDIKFALDLIPNSKGYKPSLVPKQVVHRLSDGGSRIHNIRKKWDTQLTLNYVSEGQRDLLFDLWDSGEAFNFCPFGTATSWDKANYEVVWDGPFSFFNYSDDAASSGFSGKITLKETPF